MPASASRLVLVCPVPVALPVLGRLPVFNATSLRIPFHVLAGNHDHYVSAMISQAPCLLFCRHARGQARRLTRAYGGAQGNITAQLAYADLNPRWKFPDLNYTWTETVDAATHTTIQFIFLDSVELAGNSDVHDPETGELLHELAGDELLGPVNETLAAGQLLWLEDTLAHSTASYVIVATHYPVYSICEHGSTSKL
jgi:3',5'-cyclic AMP phosphodiesterase CpdA